jgi:N-acetylmuramoyl-L-alanine amidase/beta-lactamase class A
MASRRKEKTALRINPAEMPRMPKARRKGGQYIYPAGAYRKAMIAPPVSMPKVIEEFPPDFQQHNDIVPAVEPLVPATENTGTAVIPAPRPAYWYWAAAGVILAAVTLCAGLFSKGTGVQNPYATKLQPLPQTRDTSGAYSGDSESAFMVFTDLETLRQPLEDYISELEGDWSVYLKNLNSGQVLTISDRQMPSASLIKLFVAGCYLEEAEKGNIERTEQTEKDLELMITVSDNDAWSRLETVIGHGSYDKGLQLVTAFAQDHGYKETGRLIGAPSIYHEDAENYSSVSDMGRALEEINSGMFVSEAASETILNLMKNQQRTAKIPAGLPEGIVCANKTGELRGIDNDAAIVYGSDTDYILVIMSHENYTGTKPLAEMSAMIYEALNPDEEAAEQS